MAVRQSRRLVRAALAGVVLIAGASCNCTHISLGLPQAYSPGGWKQGSPAPSGGSFTPTQARQATGGPTTVCNPPQTVSGTLCRFYPPSQGPNPGENAFRGYVFNVGTGQALANDTYVLQWTVNINNLGCATRVAGSSTDVTFPATYGSSYKIAAHFKPGCIPTNPTNILYGAWIVQ